MVSRLKKRVILEEFRPHTVPDISESRELSGVECSAMGWWYSTSYFPCRHVLHSHTHNWSRSLIDSLTQGHLRPLSGDRCGPGSNRLTPAAISAPYCGTPEDIGVATRKEGLVSQLSWLQRGDWVSSAGLWSASTRNYLPTLCRPQPTLSIPWYSLKDFNMISHNPKPIWYQMGILWLSWLSTLQITQTGNQFL